MDKDMGDGRVLSIRIRVFSALLPIFYVALKGEEKIEKQDRMRGYATERQKGLLIVEKLDYLQSKLLQGIFFVISKPLAKVGVWITEAFKSASQEQDAQVWTERVKLWFKELPLFQQSDSYSQQTSDNLLEVAQLSDNDDLPIWLAAQRAVARYEGILSPVGPRGRLLRRLLMWIGLIPYMPERPFDLEYDVTTSEPYLRLV
ncbi:hypothetical protein CsSME_00006382 [Camellia sinensis var. sinensis]